MAIMPFLFSACSKSESNEIPKPEQELVKVSFSTEGFRQSVDPMSTKSSTKQAASGPVIEKGFYNGGGLINDLLLVVYNSKDELVFTEHRNASIISGQLSEINGDFSLELPKGKYKVGVLGFTHGAAQMYFDFNYTNRMLHQFGLAMASGTGFDVEESFIRESFVYKYNDFTINSDTVVAPLKLERITSKLNIVMEDEIPVEARYIMLGGALNALIYPFQGTTDGNKYKGYVKFQIGASRVKNVTLSTPIYPTLGKEGDTNNLVALIYDENYVLIGQKTIPNIILKSNHITTLSGKMFDYNADKTANFKATIVKEYSTDNIEGTY